LPDERCEHFINIPLSFMRFLGPWVGHPVPDLTLDQAMLQDMLRRM
jgi:hypothetical protein